MPENSNHIDDDIKEYSDWIDKNIPINDDWIEEINAMSFIRQEIHNQITDGKVNSENVELIRTLDKKWQQQIVDTLNKNFQYTDKPEDNYATSLWWWHIDQIHELAKEDLESL